MKPSNFYFLCSAIWNGYWILGMLSIIDIKTWTYPVSIIMGWVCLAIALSYEKEGK